MNDNKIKLSFFAFFAIAIIAVGYFAFSASHGDNAVHMKEPMHQN